MLIASIIHQIFEQTSAYISKGVDSGNESNSETEAPQWSYEEDYEIQAESSDIEEIKAQTRFKGDNKKKNKQ